MGMVLALAVVALAFWFWMDSLRAREHVLQACRGACAELGVQLLDETVAVSRVGLARGPSGRLQLRRRYDFEFSRSGADRWHGRAIVQGLGVESVQLDDPDGATLLDAPRLHRHH